MRTLAIALVALGAAACGGTGGGATTPTTPTTPTQANRAPVINNVTVNPTSGLQGHTLFNFSVSASDADNDGLNYTWDIAGSARSGQNAAITFTNGGTGTATVTVTDGKGGSVQGSQTFVVNTMTGNWTGTGYWGSFTMNITQNGTLITGTYTDKDGVSTVGPTGEPGTIDASGNFSLRVKLAPFTDFTFKGTLDGTGRKATGGFFGSGATGQPFTMTK
jgi:hypothetical protein